MEPVNHQEKRVYSGVQFLNYDKETSTFRGLEDLKNISTQPYQNKEDIQQLQEKVEALTRQKSEREKVIDEHKNSLAELKQKVEILTKQKIHRDKIIEEHKIVEKNLRERLANKEKSS